MRAMRGFAAAFLAAMVLLAALPVRAAGPAGSDGGSGAGVNGHGGGEML